MSLDWAAALDALGIRELTPDALRQTAGFILKNNEDLNVLDELDNMPEPQCSCGHHHHLGEDKFRLVHPDTNWEAGVEYGEEIGLGNRDYELVNVK